MTDKPSFDKGIVTDNTPTSSSGESSGPAIPDIDEGVAQLVIDAVEDKGGRIELPAFARDGIDLPEQYVEYYGLDDVETLSVEDLFGQNWEDYDYIGTPPVFASENLEEEDLDVYEDDELYKSDGDMKKYVVKPEYVEQFRDANVHKGATTPVPKAINGHFADIVTETFGDDAKVSVGKGKSRNHDGDESEAMTHVAFWVSRSETADYKREKARMEAGNTTESEFAEWARGNGHEDQLEE